VKAVLTGRRPDGSRPGVDSDVPRLRQADGARRRQSALSISGGRRRGRHVARNAANDAASRLVVVEYEQLDPDRRSVRRQGATRRILRDDRENKTNHIYHWEVGKRAETDAALAAPT
jgi:hypothetical protein